MVACENLLEKICSYLILKHSPKRKPRFFLENIRWSDDHIIKWPHFEVVIIYIGLFVATEVERATFVSAFLLNHLWKRKWSCMIWTQFRSYSNSLGRSLKFAGIMAAVICGGSFDVDWLTSVVLSYDNLCLNDDTKTVNQKEMYSWYQCYL